MNGKFFYPPPQFFRLRGFRFEGRPTGVVLIRKTGDNNELEEIFVEGGNIFFQIPQLSDFKGMLYPLYVGVKGRQFSYFFLKGNAVIPYYKSENSKRNFYLIPRGAKYVSFPNILNFSSPFRTQPLFRDLLP